MRVLSGLCCAACTAPLLDEAVLGADIEAIVLDGAPGERFGEVVATDGQVVLIASGGTQTVHRYHADGTWLWESAPLPAAPGRLWAGDWALVPGHGLYRLGAGEATPEPGHAGGVVRCPEGWRDVPGASVAACGPSGAVLSATCAQEVCAVSLDGDVLDEVGPVASVGFLDGVACWAGVDIPADPQAGTVRCADGRALEGISGDHLGHSIGGGWAAGVFNKWTVPPRARMVSGDGRVWAVDRAAERTGLAVASADGLTVVGVPGYAGEYESEGRVFLAGP